MLLRRVRCWFVGCRDPGGHGSDPLVVRLQRITDRLDRLIELEQRRGNPVEREIAPPRRKGEA